MYINDLETADCEAVCHYVLDFYIKQPKEAIEDSATQASSTSQASAPTVTRSISIPVTNSQTRSALAQHEIPGRRYRNSESQVNLVTTKMSIAKISGCCRA